MSCRIEVVTPPTKEPLDAAEVREHLRIDHTDDTNYIDNLITAARKYFEELYNISLIDQTLALWIDNIPTSNKDTWWNGVRVGAISSVMGNAEAIELHRGPVQSITSVTSYDEDDTGTVWDSSNYYGTFPDDNVPPARLCKKKSATWPTPDREFDGIKIIYVAGYGDVATVVPMDIKQGLLMLVAHWYGLGRQPVISEDVPNSLQLTLADVWSKYQELRI